MVSRVWTAGVTSTLATTGGLTTGGPVTLVSDSPQAKSVTMPRRDTNSPAGIVPLGRIVGFARIMPETAQAGRSACGVGPRPGRRSPSHLHQAHARWRSGPRGRRLGGRLDRTRVHSDIRLRSTSENGAVGASRKLSEACIRVLSVFGVYSVSCSRLEPSLPTYVRHGARKELE